jgi:hypothetical protein
MTTTLVYGPRSANTPEAGAAPEHLADPSATVESLAAHVEFIADLLASLDGNDPLPSKSNRASRLDAPPAPGSLFRAAPFAPLLESLRSGNCRLEDLVQVLAAQLALVRKGSPPDRLIEAKSAPPPATASTDVPERRQSGGTEPFVPI